jgi:hypothetical protein
VLHVGQSCTTLSLQVQELEQEVAIVSLHTKLSKKIDQLAFITNEKIERNINPQFC